MRKRNRRILAFLLASAVGVSGTAFPADTVRAEEAVQEYVVMAKNDAGYETVEEACGEALTEESLESEELADNNIAVAELTETEAKKLEKDRNILLVEEDILFEGSAFEGADFNRDYGTDFAPEEQAEMKAFLKELRGGTEAVAAEDQWNIDAIHANGQEYREAEEQVKVAVMDTGVTLTEDIAVAGRVNFIEGEEDVSPLYEDVSGHGTAVAGVIAAKENDIGITGVNPDVELYSVKVLDDEKRASLSRIIEGIYWCIDNDIDIINMSFGTSRRSEILQQVVKEAEEAGILMIAAAGNLGEEAGESTVEYPAAFEEVVAVGASCPQGTASEISSAGEEVELMAPGEDVPATGYLDEVIPTEGTSMAAPHVTGAASVLWAKDRTKSSRFIRELLKAGAVSMGEEGKTGSGMVDLNYTLSIYDAFAAEYTEEAPGQAAEASELENPSEPESYEEAEVEASWNTSRHEDAVQLYTEESASALKYIRKGAKLPDLLSYMKSISGDKSREAFHGHNNYVGNYMYVMRMARICYKRGIDAALTNAVYSGTSVGKQQIDNGMALLSRELKDNFKNNKDKGVIPLESNTKENQARILVGIAVHIVMDSYAHKAYYLNNNVITAVSDNNQDNEAFVPSRWTCAKNAACDILDVWHYELEPDAIEYYQDAHKKGVFWLHTFKSRVMDSDPESYTQFASWYTNRSYAD